MSWSLKRTFLSLRNRNFRLFFIGQLISNTGNWLTNVAITLFILKLTHSGLAVGIVAACQYGPTLFLSAWGGAIADRSNKRRALLLTQILEMLQSIALAILAFMPHTSIIWLYIIAAVGGIVLAFDNPLRRSFVSEMVPESDIPNAVVLYSMIVNISRLFGPALAGLLIVLLGYGWCFSIDAATYLFVLACLWMMRPQELYRLPPRKRAPNEIREGLRYVIANPILWISFTMLAVIGTLAYNLSITLPLLITVGLHSTVSAFTIVYSIFSLGAVVSSLVIAHWGLVQLQHVILGALLFGISMLFLAAAPNVPIAALAGFLIGATSVLYMTASTAIIQMGTKREMHGRLLALQFILLAGTSLIGGPLYGWLADVFGARTPIVFGGIVCLVASGFGLIMKKIFTSTKIVQLL